jgi:uncharacterized protein (DUF111 family)
MAEDQVSPGEFQGLRRDVGEVKDTMKALVQAFNRLDLLAQSLETHASQVTKHDNRLDSIEHLLHQSELREAQRASFEQRIQALEEAAKEDHLKMATAEARFHTLMWGVRSIWSVLGIGGIAAVLRYLSHGAL